MSVDVRELQVGDRLMRVSSPGKVLVPQARHSIHATWFVRLATHA